MAGFIAKNLINGKLTWERVENSKTYSKYADAALAVLESNGYMIDSDGKCVPIPKTDAE